MNYENAATGDGSGLQKGGCDGHSKIKGLPSPMTPIQADKSQRAGPHHHRAAQIAIPIALPIGATGENAPR